MKKTLLALAVAALSANAFAVNLDTPATPGTQVFAQEIKVAAAGTDIGAALVTATVNAGFALPNSYVRFTLNNGAKFKAAPTLTGTTGVTPVTPGNIEVASGGAGQDFVIFNIKEAVTPATVLTLASANGITVVNKNAVGITYGIYETAGGAVAQTGNLKTTNNAGTLLSFAPALEVKATPATSLKIDAIGSESKKFAGTPAVVATPLTTLSVGVATPAPLLKTGVAVAAATDIAPTAAWTVNGNFSAATATGLTAAAGGAATIATDKQSVTFAANAVAPALVTYTVTGTTEIAETGVSATFTPTVAADYEVAPVTIANAGKLEKNGTTQAVDLALKPGGVYSNFVRISNKDTIPGAFFIKVINDAGQSASFPLSAVAGQPATLAAGASTTQLSIQGIFDAAAAKGLALSGEGKLRLEVTGQTNNLSVQSYTVAKDGNSFATF